MAAVPHVGPSPTAWTYFTSIGCHGEIGLVGKMAAVPVHGDEDAIAAELFHHAWHYKSGI